MQPLSKTNSKKRGFSMRFMIAGFLALLPAVVQAQYATIHFRAMPEEESVTVVVSGDGRSIFAHGSETSRDHSIYSFTAGGQPLKKYSGHAEPVCTIDVSTDGKTLLSASLDGTVRLWGKASATWAGFGDEACLALVSPDGKRLLGGNSSLALIGDEKGAVRARISGGPTETGAILAGGTYLTYGTSNELVFWGEKGQRLASYKAPGDIITGLSISPDQKLFAVATHSGDVFLVDSKGKELGTWRSVLSHCGKSPCPALAPSLLYRIAFVGNDTVVVGGSSGGLVFLPLKPGAESPRIEGLPEPLRLFSSGNFAVVAFNDGSIRRFRKDGTLDREVRQASPDGIASVSCSDDCEIIALGFYDGSAEILRTHRAP